MSWQIWLIISGICLIIEIITVGFLIFWLSIAGLLTMVVSFFTDNLIIQLSVFVISSAILILVTKPFVKKFVNSKNSIQTNVYSQIGKTGIVTQEIDSIHSTRSDKSKWRNLVCNWKYQYKHSSRYQSKN